MPDPDSERSIHREPEATAEAVVRRPHWRLTTGVLRSLLAIYLLVSAAFGALALWAQWQDEVAAHRRELQAVLQSVDGPVQRALWSGDESQLSLAMNAVAQLPGVLAVAIRNDRGVVARQVLGQAVLGPLASRLSPQPVTVSRPLRRPGEPAGADAGTLSIASDERLVVERLARPFVAALALAVLKSAVLLLLVSATLRRRLTRPLVELARQARALQPGRGALRPLELPGRADAELSTIVSSINQLLVMVEKALSNESALVSSLARQVGQLEQARKSLVESEKMAALGSLVAGVAHEINTPVGLGLTGATHMNYLVGRLADRQRQGKLTDEELTDFLADAAELSRSITHSLERAAHLVRSFNLVAVDQSLDEYRLFHPRSYIEDLLLTHATMLRLAGVSTRVEARPDLTVYSDPGAWAQVLSNLINNAVLHAFADRPEGASIVIEVEERGDLLQLSVTDNGAGMPADAVRRVFEPFFTTNRSRGGSGLGMHIVYNVVTQRLAGEIRVDSSPGRGTAVCIDLPVMAPPQGGQVRALAGSDEPVGLAP